jgi:hypothetical protein
MTNPDSLSAPKSAKTVPPVIGVFDSGAGGLTVLRALRALLPEARYIYLGDTARLPYGSKSQQTVARFAIESARFLAAQGAECLVIACNTASALALPEIRDAVSPVPVFGVIEAGADIARERSISGDVCVLATPATVASRAYTRACRARGLRTTEKACPLLVPLVEEGWIAHAVTRDVLRIYLAEAAAQAENAGLQPDTLSPARCGNRGAGACGNCRDRFSRGHSRCSGLRDCRGWLQDSFFGAATTGRYAHPLLRDRRARSLPSPGQSFSGGADSRGAPHRPWRMIGC